MSRATRIGTVEEEGVSVMETERPMMFGQHVSRRDFVRLAAAAAAALPLASLLAACGGDPPEADDTPTPQPTAGGTGTTPTAASGAGTTQTSPSPTAAATGAAGSPTAQATAADVTEGGTLQLGITDISTMNPFVSNTIVENYVLMMLYPTLATLDDASGRVPYLAESWESASDGLSHTIKIREGFMWEDGEPLTAADVKFTAEFEKEQAFSWHAGLVDAVTTIDLDDDYTLTINMSSPVGTFITDFTFWFRIMPKHVWETIEDPKTYPNEQPIGAGPFSLTRWEKAQFIELEARKDYNFPPVGRPPYIDKMIYRIYPDINTLVLAFQNGDIDVVPSGVPVDSVEAIAADSNFATAQNPSTGYNHVSPNIALNEALADVRVRQALAHGIDKQAIVDLLLKGYGGVMTTITSPVLTEWYNPDVEDYPFDVEAGKKILEDAGLTDLEFRLSYSSNDPNSQKIAPILKENWEKLGVTINLDGQEGNALYQRVRFEHDFDLWFSGWGITDNPPFSYYNFLHSSQYKEGSNNFVGLQDQAFDDLILQTYQEADMAKAIEGVKQLQVMEHELVPVFALYYPEFVLAYNKTKWDGFQVLPGSLLGIASWQSMLNVHQIG
jgi:peptide/nickel transport system substrate-binding protein